MVLLVALFFRVHDLRSFPPFIDEAHHILWSSDVYTLHPFTGAANGKLFGLWWMAAFGMDGDGALWLARASTALFSLIGVAGVYRIGALLTSRGVGRVAALAYALAPFGLFFDRMALVDPHVVVFGVLVALFSLGYARRGDRRSAVLVALALVGAVLAKATGIVLAALPLLALVTLTPRRWRERLGGLALCYGLFAAFWLPFYGFLRWRGYNYFGTATTVVGSDDLGGALDRLLPNLRAALRIDIAYLGAPLMLLAAGAVVYVLLRRPRVGLYLLLASLVPLAGLLMFTTRLSTRYIHFHLPFLILLLVVGVGVFAADLQRVVRLPRGVALSALLAAWLATTVLPFLGLYARDPLALALPDYDRVEYFSGDSAGFGLPEIAQAVSGEDAASTVVGLFSNCEGLRRSLPASSNVTVECPRVALDGSRQAEIAARVDAVSAERGASDHVWVVLEADSSYFSLDGIEARLERVREVTRPDALTRLWLYRVVP